MVSIKDIARAAHVSHSTVSRALRDSSLVNPQTRALIRRIAQEQGYMVSAVARSLVNRRTNTIGVVVTTIADPFAGEVVSGIEEFFLPRDYSVILAACHSDRDRELRAVHSFHQRRVDGILVMASRVGAMYIPMLSEMKVPIVLINSHHPGEFVHSVRIDDFSGAQEAVRHLLGLGHSRIGYIGDRLGFQSDAERSSGYRRTLEESGLGFDPSLIAYGDGSPESGRVAMHQLLTLPDAPTAVFCYNDREALGAMRAVRERGLRVPQDVSLCGFDDLFLSSYTEPALTTIRQPKREMGLMAGEMLFQLLSGESPASRITTGSLVVRESTTASATPLTTPGMAHAAGEKSSPVS
jgi:LacI family transcriptional regulator/LacI family repressor for deo operon, udp, cdd, tsx, nupC, and nupG